MSQPVLTQTQIASYLDQGYLLVSDLIPAEQVRRAEQAMWRCMGLAPDEPAAWPGDFSGHAGYPDPDLTAVYTEDLLTAAWQLGEGNLDRSHFRPPSSGYALNTFPTDEEWAPHGPHIDHSIKEHGHETFPPAFRLASMTFLNDVAPHGGGTVVWPASHKKVAALARSNPDHYRTMWMLGDELDKADIGECVEITPRAGDVLFYHVFCVHSGSRNTSASPRLAMNKKW
jgi:hypothetical protein